MKNDYSDITQKIKYLIEKQDKNCLINFPVKNYIEEIEVYPHVSSYNFKSEKINLICKALTERTGQETLNLYHKLVLIELIRKAKIQLKAMKFSEDIFQLFQINFERIVSDIRNDYNQELYYYEKDKFRKDLALCSLRLIPAGAQKIHLNSLPRRFLVKGGLQQFVKGSFIILMQLKGTAPFYEMHTDSNDPHLMQQFNPNGWIKFYKRVAKLLLSNPGIKGVFGSSWFFDPSLNQVSPRLSYLMKIPVDNGAQLFRIGFSEQSARDATLKSKTRKRLYLERKYIPTSYMVVWGRKKLIDWCRAEGL